MSWECISNWIEHHAGLSSWVQAFGSMAAIGAAIWIANRDSRVRRMAEHEITHGALVRAITTVDDAHSRARAAVEMLGLYGVLEGMSVGFANGFAQSQEHLKEALSSQGVNAAVYAHLFTARTGVEDVENSILSFKAIGYIDPARMSPALSAVSRIEEALIALLLMQNEFDKGFSWRHRIK